MIWILATRGAATKLRLSPFTETPIEGVHSIVYKPGIEAVPLSGIDTSQGQRGTFTRGLHRASGLLFSYDGSVAETHARVWIKGDQLMLHHVARRRQTLVGERAVEWATLKPLDTLRIGPHLISFSIAGAPQPAS